MANEQNLKSYKKGQSGNPNGRPKGVPNSKTRYQRILNMLENVKNPITGDMEKLTVMEILDLMQIKRARSGDLKAYKEILDRLEGKAQQNVDMTTLGKELPTPIYGGASMNPPKK